MVMKSFFARLFGRAEDNGAADRKARRSRPETSSRRFDSSRIADADEADAPSVQDATEGAETAGAVSSADFSETAFVAPIATGTTRPPIAENPAPASGPPVPSKPMTKEEELALKLTQGFQGISSVLTGIDRKIDEQQKSSAELMVTVRQIPELVKDVPESQRLGLEILARISTALDAQSRSTTDLLSHVSALPAAIAELEQGVAEQARTSAEAERASRESREMVGSALADVRGSVSDLEARSAKRQEALLAELKDRQAQRDRQVNDLIQRSARSSRMLVFLLVVVIVTLLLVVRAVAA